MEWPTLATFAHRPRDALMWIPRAVDIARIRAALDVAGPRRIDVGAGTGLLVKLLDADVVPFEPHPPRVRYTEPRSLALGPGLGSGPGPGPGPDAFDVAIVSWMEAGKDYRAEVAKLAPVVINAYDIEGGCGVKGDVSFAPFGYAEAASWRTPSFEDAQYAIEHRGILRRRAYPGNRVDVLSREPRLLEPLRAAVADARAAEPYPWEREMDALGL